MGDIGEKKERVTVPIPQKIDVPEEMPAREPEPAAPGPARDPEPART